MLEYWLGPHWKQYIRSTDVLGGNGNCPSLGLTRFASMSIKPLAEISHSFRYIDMIFPCCLGFQIYLYTIGASEWKLALRSHLLIAMLEIVICILCPLPGTSRTAQSLWVGSV